MSRLAAWLLLSLGPLVAPAPMPASLAAGAEPTPAQVEPAVIQFLDIGQGDAILIRAPEDRVALIDAGPSSQVVPLLRRLGVTRIDLLVVSHHHHLDHYGGMEAVIQEYGPPVYMASTSSYTSPMYLKLLKLVEALG